MKWIHLIKDDNKGRTRIEGWIKALDIVGEIPGIHTDSWVNDDPGMIAKIVTDVSNKLLHSTESSDFNGLVGMGAHMKRMESLLRLDLKEVRMIGIWGPPGIGKTTIAKSIFNDHSKSFELSTTMEDIKRNFRGTYPDDVHGMKLNLQKKFLAQIISQSDLEISHLEFAPNRLKNKKVLVVLDNVDRLEQLEAMANSIEWFGPGSRIVITTEDQDVLKKHDMKYIYKVIPPNDKEALEIFCTNAFGQKSPKQGFEELAREATQLSRGLPLGLTIFGSYFKKKAKQEWKPELSRLKISLHGDIKDILMFSYEALWAEDKKLFLRIANLFKGERIERQRLQDFLGESLGIEVLVNKSLLSNSMGYIKMHSLLVQFGREIVRYDSKQKDICGQFLDDAKEIVQALTDEMGSVSLIGIDLNLSEIKRQIKISENAFRRTFNLRFLKVYYKLRRGNTSGTLILPPKLDYLSGELRLLHWEYFPMACLPFDFNTEFLVKLYMPYSKLEMLWEGVQPLEYLKEVDLAFSEDLEKFPDLSTATNLKRLDLTNCTKLVELPDSIGKAINLETLNISGCSNLRKLPSSIGNATNLQRLILIRCSSLVELPSSLWDANNLEYIDLTYCSNLVKLPAPVKKCSKLCHLILRNCSKLVEFPNTENFVNLMKLYFGGCSSMVKLPSSIGNATNLIELDLSGCSNLVELPSTIGNFHKLFKLTMKGCSKLEALPSIISLKSLNELDLTNCFLLRSFPEVSTNIKVLKLSGTAIKEVPSSIMSWPRRPSELYMSYFEDLKELSHAFGIITVLHLSDRETQEVAPWIKNLSRLRQLVLNGCRKLKSIPQLPDSLTKLDAKNCESLERLDCSFPNPKIRLNFANCLKLNQEARNLIIQTSTSAHAILSGGEVPPYFTQRAAGDSLTMNLKEKNLPTSLRFKVCILLVKVADNAGDWKTMRVSSHVEKPNALIVKYRPSSQYLTLPLTEHLYTFEIEVNVKSRKLVFSFKVDTNKWKIGECGMKLLDVPRVCEHGESSRSGAESADITVKRQTLELKSES